MKKKVNPLLFILIFTLRIAWIWLLQRVIFHRITLQDIINGIKVLAAILLFLAIVETLKNIFEWIRDYRFARKINKAELTWSVLSQKVSGKNKQ